MKDWWENNKGNIVLGILVLYTLSLVVITVDEVFRMGWFPTALEKQINAQVDVLVDGDEGQRNLAAQRLLEIGDFSVPALIKQLDAENPTVRENTTTLLTKLTGQRFGTDTERWKTWFRKNRDRF